MCLCRILRLRDLRLENVQYLFHHDTPLLIGAFEFDEKNKEKNVALTQSFPELHIVEPRSVFGNFFSHTFFLSPKVEGINTCNSFVFISVASKHFCVKNVAKMFVPLKKWLRFR